MRRLLFKFLIILVLFLFLIPIFSFGQTAPGYHPLTKIEGFVDENSDAGLANYINAMFHLGIYIATGLAVIMIVVGGFIYISGDAITNKSEGKEYVTSALWGLFLVLISWAILNTINPKLLEPTLQVSQTATNSSGVPGIIEPSLGDRQIINSEVRPNGTFYDFLGGGHAWVPPDNSAVNCYDSNWSWISYGPCR